MRARVRLRVHLLHNQRSQRAMCKREAENHEWGGYSLGHAESRLRQLHRAAAGVSAEIPGVLKTKSVWR